MAKLVTEIKILDLDMMDTFFSLIADNADCIHEPLKSKLQEWIDAEEKGWVSWSEISPEYIKSNDCRVMLNGHEQFFVTGYNKILRKVKVLERAEGNKPCFIRIVEAQSFSINNNRFSNFVEW
tara:strand:+ start:141 stop:509 length:369 start_codon:yes stop_codon:yes gene_type:complete